METDRVRIAAARDDGVMDRPPERIDVPEAGVVLRRHRPDDAHALNDMIEASRDHLRPFMPWADQDRDATASYIGRTAEGWAMGDNFSYLVTEPAPPPGGGERLLGGCGMHRRGEPGTIEIGYWLRSDAVGRGVMTAVSRALAVAGFGLDGITRVEIRCDAANTRSAAIPRRLGFQHVGDVDSELTAPGHTGRHQIWACEDSSVVSSAPAAP
jgi:RimJ/RimL family protein N-acetyltransferase